jgi:hypothetical protein
MTKESSSLDIALHTYYFGCDALIQFAKLLYVLANRLD